MDMNIHECAKLFGSGVMIVSKEEKEMIQNYRKEKSYIKNGDM